MKSIFYNPLDVRIHQKKFEEVKTLISEQESLGNKVLLPKINEDVIFVQIKDSSFVKIYSIKQQTFIRMFNLYKTERPMVKAKRDGAHLKTINETMVTLIKSQEME